MTAWTHWRSAVGDVTAGHLKSLIATRSNKRRRNNRKNVHASRNRSGGMPPGHAGRIRFEFRFPRTIQILVDDPLRSNITLVRPIPFPFFSGWSSPILKYPAGFAVQMGIAAAVRIRRPAVVQHASFDHPADFRFMCMRRYCNDIFLPADHTANAQKRRFIRIDIGYVPGMELAITRNAVFIEPLRNSKAITDVGVVCKHRGELTCTKSYISGSRWRSDWGAERHRY